MITFQYYPFEPDDSKDVNTGKLMSMIFDMIMKYDMSLEESLRYLIEKGLPVNLFLKRGGLEDFIIKYKQQIDSIMQSILEKYTLEPLLKNIEETYNNLSKDILSQIPPDSNSYQKLQIAISNKNEDVIRRSKWELEAGNSSRLYNKMEDLLDTIANYNIIEKGILDYPFAGEDVPELPEAIEIIHKLNELKELANALDWAYHSGELFNIDLRNIARYLGEESYREFVETREKIFEQLVELLKKNGSIVESEEEGIRLSSESIRKIGKKSLNEIFANLKNDHSFGQRVTNEVGDSENSLSATRKLEFGDNLSHIDFPSSIVNSIVRGNGSKPRLADLEVYLSRGAAKSSTVILLDMSGSMMRASRFYNAKKVTLALEALIREEYKDEKLTIIGFGTLARVISLREMPLLQPYPVTIYDPYIKLKYDLSKMSDEEKKLIPTYFTNLQRGLQLARQTISSKQYKNKQIILITDGAPTAHFDKSILHINYPPIPASFDAALNELKNCVREDIIINTFLLTSEWDFNYFGEESFIQRFAKISKGRIFYPHPSELNQMILYDFINHKKKKINF